MSSSSAQSGGNIRTSIATFPLGSSSTCLTTTDSSAFVPPTMVANGRTSEPVSSHTSQRKTEACLKPSASSKDGTVAMVIKPLDSSGPDKDEEINVEEVEPEKKELLATRFSNKKHSIILNLKKNTKDHNNSSYSAFQDAGKNDSYCWVCHEGGEVLCCDKCPRVFHFKCTKLDQEPEGDEWFCPVCLGLSKKIKKTRPNDLKECLQLAVHRMMLPGTDLFQTDVSDDLREEYRQLVFHPLHLGMIKAKVQQNGYSTTRDFLADTEWIHHNCIIFNGARHELTKIAKNIIRQCQNDMKEIELASCCFKNMAMKKDWFEVPCSPPHEVVLAKVNRYPFWPAKLINIGQDKCDVRFFGQHDRAIVPKASVQKFTGTLTTPTSLTSAKLKEWTSTVSELKRYLQNVHAMQGLPAAGFPQAVHVDPPTSSPVASNGVVRKEPPSSVQSTASGGSQPSHLSQTTSVMNGVTEDPVSMDTSEQPTSMGLPQRDSDSGSESHNPESDSEDQGDGDFVPKVPQRGRVHRGGGAVGRGSHGTVTRGGSTASLQSKVGTVRPPSGTFPRTSPVMNRKRPAPVHPKKPKKQSMAPPPAQLPAVKVSHNPQVTSSASLPTPAASTQVIREKVTKTTSVVTPVPLSSAGQQLQHLVVPSTSHITPTTAIAAPVLPVGTAAQPIPSSSTTTSSQPQQLPKPQVLNEQIKNVFNIKTHPGITNTGSSSQASRQNPLPPSPLPTKTSGDGLLSRTINAVGPSLAASQKMITGPSNDMGYHHYSEKLMGAAQLVLLEMLADFHVQGKEGAKVIGDQLLSSWPISPSHRMMQELRQEMKNELDQRIEHVKTAAKLDYESKLQELKKQFEQEKKKDIDEAVNAAVTETKKKHWCSYCSKEAAHYCCWNANYCSEECQNNHWLEHQKQCLNPQVTGMSSATPSDVTGGGRVGVSLTPNLMSPSHEGRTGQVFSFGSSNAAQGVPPQPPSTLPGHTPHIQQGTSSDTESLSQPTLMSNVALATSIPATSIAHQGIPIRTSVASSIPISPNLQVTKSSPSLHSNPSSVSTSGSSLTTHSDSNTIHPPHSDNPSSVRTMPGHHGDPRHGLVETSQLTTAQTTPLTTPQTPLYWPYQQTSSRYTGGFPHHIMMYQPDTNILYQQQLIAEQQNSGGGSVSHQ